MINEFLNWAQQQPNSESLHNLASRVCSDRPITAWIVSTEQLLAWVRNPTPLSQLDDFAPLKCSKPAVDASVKICNGIPENEAGLVQLCPFSDFPFYTCVRTCMFALAIVICAMN